MNKRVALFLGIVIAAGALIPLGIAWWRFSTQEPAADFLADRAPQQVGVLIPLDPAQPVPKATIVTKDGRQVTLAELARGRLTVINLWATWCLPCIREMHSLDRLRQAVAGEGIIVLTISEDTALEQAHAFLVREHLTGLGLYHDPRGRLAQAFGVQGLPSTYILQATDRVVARLEGEAKWDSPALIAHLKALATLPALPAQSHREGALRCRSQGTG